MDRRDALSTAPSTTPARVRDDRVADSSRRTSPKVLRDHREWARGAGRAATPVDDRHTCVGRRLERPPCAFDGTRHGMTMDTVESQIAEWRAYVAKAPAVEGRDVDELEVHLRDQIAELAAAGLKADEAFLVAVKRMGDLDTLSREFAREHSGRLWKQLVLGGENEPEHQSSGWFEALAFEIGR